MYLVPLSTQFQLDGLSCFCGCRLRLLSSAFKCANYLLLWWYKFPLLLLWLQITLLLLMLITLQSASWLQSIVALEFSMQPFLAPDYFYAFCMASTFFLASKGKLQSALVMQFWLDGVSWLKPTFLVHCSAFTSSSQCWNDFRQTSSKIF